MEGMPKFEKKQSKIETSERYKDFIPEDFSDDPIKYFEEKGVQIKEGNVEIDGAGRVREDPTAVVDFPVWVNGAGEQIQVVAKRVNIEKGQISKSRDPFYEYKVMQIVRKLNLLAPEPIAKVESEEGHVIVMERVKGYRLVGKDLEYLKQRLSDEEINNLRQQVESKVAELKSVFLEHGLERKFKLADMIVDIDFENPDGPQITKITLVDWEKTKIDEGKLGEFIED
ncbi:MAG TPA: hypothetical protein P5328_01555 [Candidatus Paceibacterota bacterium]|nr:hypothetical protein [Candidatus Paceibacterota bacterium]HRZ34679.1 hypothetical protein [Candidatus Paceibacterota bacterium]